MMTHPKTANYRAYLFDDSSKQVFYVRITKNEYVELSTCGFKCFRIMRDGFNEYSVQTHDTALWRMYLTGRKPKKLKK